MQFDEALGRLLAGVRGGGTTVNGHSAAAGRHLVAWTIAIVAATTTGCLRYGYTDATSVTPLTDRKFPATSSVDLNFRPMSESDRCLPLAMIEIEGAESTSTASVLELLREHAKAVGATAIFSVNAGRSARASGDRFDELLDPDRKQNVYSSHVVTGIAVRCLKETGTPEAATPTADTHSTGSSITTE